jgi:hypothetical protein
MGRAEQNRSEARTQLNPREKHHDQHVVSMFDDDLGLRDACEVLRTLPRRRTVTRCLSHYRRFQAHPD